MFKKKLTTPRSPRQKLAALFTNTTKMLQAEANKWVSASEMDNRWTLLGFRGYLDNLKKSGKIIDYYDIQMDEENNTLSFVAELRKYTHDPGDPKLLGVYIDPTCKIITRAMRRKENE